jgi:hypothetical protein
VILTRREAERSCLFRTCLERSKAC